MEIFYFGLSIDFDCKPLSIDSNGGIIEDLSQFAYVIKQTKKRVSNTGVTTYYGYQLLNSKLIKTVITYEGVKLLSVTDEYWWSLGSFNPGKSEIFFPNYEAPDNIDVNFFLFVDFLNWKIKDDTCGIKVCFIEIQDENGYLRRIPTCFEDSESIQHTLKRLQLLGILKSYTTFKLIVTLNQLNSIDIFGSEEQKKFCAFFENTVIELYNKSFKFNLKTHQEHPEIEVLYNKIKNKSLGA